MFTPGASCTKMAKCEQINRARTRLGPFNLAMTPPFVGIIRCELSVGPTSNIDVNTIVELTYEDLKKMSKQQLIQIIQSIPGT